MASTQGYQVIVIGAGWYGLAAAKSYLAVHPDHNVLVIEAESTVGGTWSKDRLYPGLKSNNLFGSYQYPDFDMSEEVYGVSYGQHIPAAVLHQYLTDFAKKFGVFERVRFQTKVTAIEAVEATGGWRVHTTSLKPESNGETTTFETEKLIVASGLTSEPNLPRYKGQETFTSEFFHAKDFCRKADVVKTAKTAVVVGGGKSALDCAYALATDPGAATVHLIIRPRGDGPLWLAPAFVTPFKRMMEELLATRFLTWFSPTIFGGEDGYGGVRNFLHGSRLGRALVKGFWSVLQADVLTAHGYAKHVEVSKLTPWQSPMWTGSGVGIHNYDSDFFELVRQGKVLVHVADIDHLDGRSVYLSTRPAQPIEDVDVVICATGWKKDAAVTIRNFDIGLAAQDAERDKLIAQADEQVLKEFPMLKDQPILTYTRGGGSGTVLSAPGDPNSSPSTNTKGTAARTEPLRNYRYIVPTQAFFGRTLAYAGMVSTVTTSIFASVQALWITAYFDGKLSRAPNNEDEVVNEVMLHTQWNKWRYPCGYGASLPDFAFDSIPYVDLLVRDLGLDNHRGKGAVADIFKPYKPWDYAGLDQEWLASQQTKNA